MQTGFLIGELSHRTGIPAQTIRYYERLQLLDAPQRTDAGYRLYSPVAQARLGFIQKAKRFGLSLDEIRQLIQIRSEGVPPCQDFKQMVKKHLDDLDEHLQEILALRQELKSKYELIDKALPDGVLKPTNDLCDGEICSFIERDLEK